LQTAFTSKYEYQQRDLWAKIERSISKTTELFKRVFWTDFFGIVKDELKDSTGNSQICAIALSSNLKNEADFNDPKIQKQIRDSLGDYTKTVGKLVSDRSKTFITSAISTHRGSKLISPDVFGKLNTRANLK
jgi:hypothetical protein